MKNRTGWTLRPNDIEADDEAAEVVMRDNPLTVETSDNHVYFYAPVNSDRCLALIREIRSLDRMLRLEHVSRDLPESFPKTPIWLHVHSGGGDVFSGLGAADQLAQIETPVHSIVEGYCASAATLIAMACDRRYVMPSAFMLIHQIWSLAWGTYEELKDEVHMQGMVMKRLTDFYTDRSTMGADEIAELLKRDSWFSADECLERGMVDAVYGR